MTSYVSTGGDDRSGVKGRGQNNHHIIGQLSRKHGPFQDNVNQAFFSANVASAGPGAEVTIQIPCQDGGVGSHSVWTDVVIEFQVQEPGDDLDILVRSGAALIRDLRVLADRVEICRVDTAFELDLLFRESLRSVYDPRNLKVAGWVPPGVDSATGSVVATGYETYPAAPNAATYAFKRSAIPGVSSSPIRHRFQLSLATAFGPLFHNFDPRRFKELELRITWMPNTSLTDTNRAIAFSANTGDYSQVTFTNIGARVYRQVWFSRPPAFRLNTREPTCFLQYQYDFAHIPIDLTGSGTVTTTLNLNNLFPVRDNCTRILWCLAPVAPTDSATVGFMFETSATNQALHTPHYYTLSWQGSAVQRVQTGYELEQMRSNFQRKRYKNADEYAIHPQATADWCNMDFADLCSGYREMTPGVHILNGISVGSFGSAANYVLELQTVPYRPALSGGPAQLVVILESQYIVHVGPGENTGGPAPVIHVVGA